MYAIIFLNNVAKPVVVDVFFVKFKKRIN